MEKFYWYHITNPAVIQADLTVYRIPLPESAGVRVLVIPGNEVVAAAEKILACEADFEYTKSNRQIGVAGGNIDGGKRYD